MKTSPVHFVSKGQIISQCGVGLGLRLGVRTNILEKVTCRNCIRSLAKAFRDRNIRLYSQMWKIAKEVNENNRIRLGWGYEPYP